VELLHAKYQREAQQLYVLYENQGINRDPHLMLPGPAEILAQSILKNHPKPDPTDEAQRSRRNDSLERSFVSGHDFSRAEKVDKNELGFSPCYSSPDDSDPVSKVPPQPLDCFLPLFRYHVSVTVIVFHPSPGGKWKMTSIGICGSRCAVSIAQARTYASSPFGL